MDSGDEDVDGSDADMEMDEATKAKLGTGMSKFKTWKPSILYTGILVYW